MKLRPTIFLSGVSSEFGSFRDAVEVEVQKKGCFAENQSSFGVDYHTVEEMLRRRIKDSDAVIHIVGFRFGAEPKDRPTGKPRRSYTQMEYDIARELDKPVYVFLSSDATVVDTVGKDDAEATALQLAHRQAIQNDKPLYYFFGDKAELCKLAGEIDIVAHADLRVDISRIDRYAPAELIGREDELALLNDAWLKVRRAESSRPHVLIFVALGGEGKTSLVAKWLANLAYQNWPGCDSAFAWSFYSQGTREQYTASSDLFLKEAITFFGDAADKEFAASPAGAYEKGQRLAHIVGQRRALLILDGLEPLQYAPTSPTPGELKDAGITALLKGLAARSDGLCIVTTRYSLPNLKAYRQTTVPEILLTRLSKSAGVHLLKSLGVKGSVKEFETLVEDVKGHALTLNLFGTFLRDAHGGDIRRRDLVKLEDANAEEGGHAFRVIKAYEQRFEMESDKGHDALAVLRLLGLFDRPVTADSIDALLEPPAIKGLTQTLVKLTEAQRNLVFQRLQDAKLFTVNRDTSGAVISLDSHSLVREYFACQLRTEQPKAWRAAHRRLYEHFCTTTSVKHEATLEDLQPLYQAVAHGCQAGLQQQTLDEVYFARISRGNEFYSTKKLGAFASDLEAVACFFKTLWCRVAPKLKESDQAWILNLASQRLRSLGRLTEAIEPIRAAIKINVRHRVWREAARNASNLSELELTLGMIDSAVADGQQSVVYVDHIDEMAESVVRRCVPADALNQAGRPDEAQSLFVIAEQMQRQQSDYSLLYSVNGFRYCDLLLSSAECAAWKRTLHDSSDSKPNAELFEVIRDVAQRSAQTLEWAEENKLSLLTIALDRLSSARAALYDFTLFSAGLPRSDCSKLTIRLNNAVKGLRSAGVQEFIVRGLLSRALLRFLDGVSIGALSAQEDLDEAWEIAERGPMKLFMADIHLYRARLFFREKEYPWESPEADLAAAEKLINECGYHRRDEELADAKRVILGRSA